MHLNKMLCISLASHYTCIFEMATRKSCYENFISLNYFLIFQPSLIKFAIKLLV